MEMTEQKSNKITFITAIVVTACAAFAIGIGITDKIEDAQACHINLDGREDGARIIANLKMGGSHDACELMAKTLMSYANTESDDQDEDSAASDADAASAPIGASQ